MARISFSGIEAYSAKLAQLSAMAEEQVLGAAVYDGAAIMADAVREELEAVPVDDTHDNQTMKDGPDQKTKDALLKGLGVTPIRTDAGFINVKIGFDGYDGVKTKKYPQGRPIPMLARAVLSGTSFMQANPFVKEALRKCRKQAREAMAKRVEDEIEKIMN